MTSVLERLHGSSLGSMEDKDRRLWVGNRKGVFTVDSFSLNIGLTALKGKGLSDR